MQKLPIWVWTGIAGGILGILGGGTLVLKLPPTGNPSISPSPSPLISPSPVTSPSSVEQQLVNIKILVRDKKSKIPLEDAEVTIAAKEGIPTKRTLADGTVTFQIPKQQLGEVNVTTAKSGYIRRELPLVFAINPNEIPTIELEEDTKSPNPGDPSSPPKIDWGNLKSYFDVDDDLNIQPYNGGLRFTVHVTAKKDFNAIYFRAQPYDTFGVRTGIVAVTFSYSPQKWKTGDRSELIIDTPIISKLEIVY